MYGSLGLGGLRGLTRICISMAHVPCGRGFFIIMRLKKFVRRGSWARILHFGAACGCVACARLFACLAPFALLLVPFL
jgi:hypothetical protein